MPIASLPMYDHLPGMRRANDALWLGLVRALAREGVNDVPPTLAHDLPADKLWFGDDLFFSHCCGYDVVGRLGGKVQMLATAQWAAPGCSGFDYASAVIVRDDSPVQHFEELRGATAAINSRNSQSGMGSLRALAAPFARDGRFFGAVWESHGHAYSIPAIREGRVDTAAIDCITWTLHQRHAPETLAGLRVLCLTPAAPAGPFITRIERGAEEVARMQAALERTFTDPSLQSARDDLLIAGIHFPPIAAYGRILAMKEAAARLGYPEVV